MKFCLTFKTPDVLESVLEEVSFDSEYSCDCSGTCLNCQQLLEQAEKNKEEIKQFAKKYLVYGEYITIVFDTVAKTASVKKA